MGPLFLYILDIFYVNSITLNILNLYHLDALHISQKSNSSCTQYHRQDSYLNHESRYRQ